MSAVTREILEVIKVDWPALAQEVARDVLEKLNDDIALWNDDVSMQAMFLRDAADGLDICALLAEGKWEKAEDRLRNMDTASREWVFDFIEKHSCNDLFGTMRNQKAS